MARGVRPEDIKRVALINFGGIGDEILFAPVIGAVRRQLPHAHLTLILEDRSRAVGDLLADVDHQVDLPIQGQSRIKTFFRLWQLLRSKYFDAVISSGSSPFIPVLLWLSGIPIRVGFGTGRLSQALLSVEAPLAPRHARRGYAAEMYFALARSFVWWLTERPYADKDPVLPRLKAPPLSDRHWAKGVMPADDPRRKILIHPGVSTVSVQKNILKGWDPVHWAALIERLACDGGYGVYLAGGPDDREVVAAILRALPSDLPHFTNLYGQTRNLRQLAALMLECDVLVGVDSSPMHMAVGYHKPVVALFGPTDESKLLPAGLPGVRAVTVAELACRPCLWDVRDTSCERPVCLDVPVLHMYQAIQEVLRDEIGPAAPET